MAALRNFRGSLVFTAVCLGLAGWLGWANSGTLAGTLGVLWIVSVLAVLEVSLSFDNAIVNAAILRTMAPVWRKRFLTWGILFAVFGMRIVFPIAIVAIAAGVGPIEAVRMAATDHAQYQRIIADAHVAISGFGGAFLAMVGLTFFLDQEKDLHWLGAIERPFKGLSGVSGLAIGLVLVALYAVSRLVGGEALVFLTAGIFGLVAYVAVDAVAGFTGGAAEARQEAGVSGPSISPTGGLGVFLYLQLIDASFSFDGVIGAFALSNDLFVIALGLGIGAMFVRAMTVLLVERGTLTEYRYLEHGAFYAILALAAIMLLQARYDVPEVVTGLIGAGLIALAFWASVRSNRREARGVNAAGERSG